MNRQAIGIDLGTYNSVAAYAVDDSQVQIIKSRYGPTMQGRVFPSFLRFDAQGKVVAYGEEARQQMAFAPDMVVWGVKRLIGRSFRQVEKDLQRFAYPIEAGPDGGVIISVGSRRYTPVDISNLLLQWIKQDTESHASIVRGVGKAVVTHPAYFDTAQTEQTKEAAMRAGFDEVELIPEPVAAALAYGLQLDASSPQFIMAIDWGAGTLDIVVAALRLNRKGQPTLDEVRPARGDVTLGGIDMDDLLLAKAVEVYKLEALQSLVGRPAERTFSEEDEVLSLLEMGLPPGMRSLLDQLRGMRHPDYERPAVDTEPWIGLCRLRNCVEKAKINLSQVPAIRDYITYQGHPREVKMARTGKDCLDGDADWVILEEVLQPLLDQFRRHIEFALEQSGLGREHIQHVLLIGGPMHMPCVQRVVRDVFSTNRQVAQELQAIEELDFPVSPIEAVARGAALHARGVGPRKGIRRFPFNYGVLLGMQGQILIHENDVPPCQATLPGTLKQPGRPGKRVSVGLFRQKEKQGEEHYIRMGDYEFVPTFDQGQSRFQPTLNADRDGIVSLVMADLLSGDSLHLERLSVLHGKEIPKPFPFVDRGVQPPPTPIVSEESTPTVSEELVSQERRAARGTLQVARSKRGHPRVQAEKRIGDELEQKARILEEVLRRLPPRGSAEQQVFQKVSHRREELRALLDTHQLLSEEERRLLFGYG